MAEERNSLQHFLWRKCALSFCLLWKFRICFCEVLKAVSCLCYFFLETLKVWKFSLSSLKVVSEIQLSHSRLSQIFFRSKYRLDHLKSDHSFTFIISSFFRSIIDKFRCTIWKKSTYLISDCFLLKKKWIQNKCRFLKHYYQICIYRM